jgi:hypothetical protein
LNRNKKKTTETKRKQPKQKENNRNKPEKVLIFDFFQHYVGSKAKDPKQFIWIINV